MKKNSSDIPGKRNNTAGGASEQETEAKRVSSAALRRRLLLIAQNRLWRRGGNPDLISRLSEAIVDHAIRTVEMQYGADIGSAELLSAAPKATLAIVENLSIEQLAMAAIKGDRMAGEKLFSLLGERFLKMAQYRIRDASQELEKDAQDVTQNTMTTIVEKYETADFHKGFLPWAYTILNNKCNDHCRRNGRQMKRIIPGDPECMPLEALLSYITVESTPDLFEGLIALLREIEQDDGGSAAPAPATMTDHITAAYRKLSGKCKRIIRMLVEGYTNGDIAALLSIRKADLDIHRCRKRMYSILVKRGALP